MRKKKKKKKIPCLWYNMLDFVYAKRLSIKINLSKTNASQAK